MNVRNKRIVPEIGRNWRAPKQSKRRWKRERSHPPDGPRWVIIVEDNALVAKFFRMALERVYSVTVTTEDAPEMSKEIEAAEVDLVLVDVSLTNAQWEGQLVNGVELCKRKSPRRLPVLLATAHTMSGDRERFLEPSGADGHLAKPAYDRTVLVEKARQLME
jgi:two-component system cell cycle response regulator DivK